MKDQMEGQFNVWGHSVVSRMEAVGKTLGGRMDEAGKSAAEQMQAMNQSLGSRMEEAGRVLTDQISILGQAMGDRVEEAGRSTGERMTALDKSLTERLSQQQEQFSRTVEEKLDRLGEQNSALMEEKLSALEEAVHKECVKVYRNVQAVITEEGGRQSAALDEAGTGTVTLKGRLRTVLGISVLSAIFSLAALVMQILGRLNP